MISAEKIIALLHRLPHFNYKFHRINESFNINFNGEYAQSLVIFCAASLIVSLALLLFVVVVWIRQVCRSKSDQQLYSKWHVRLLSGGLFMTCVICFFLLGGGFYGNEQINKSIVLANDALFDFNKNIRFSASLTRRMNNTQDEMLTHLEELTKVIEQKSKHVSGINQTTLRHVDDLLTHMSDKVEKIRDSLQSIAQIFIDEKVIERFAQFTNRLEFERWCIFLVLGAIITTVLFSGVVIFSCKWQLGSVFYSGISIVIFMLVSILFSVVFPLTVGYADFCADGRPLLRSRMNNAILEMFDFYRNCAFSPAMKNAVATSIPIDKVNQFYEEVENDQRQLENLLYSLFNHTEEIDDASLTLSRDISQSFKFIGGLETILGCPNLHRDAASVYDGFCIQGFLGLMIVCGSLFFTGIFLVILLILTSKSWYIFVRRSNDYIKVSDDDHFSPRGQEMPESVYDTNIYNPRARNLNNGAVESNGSILNGMALNAGPGIHQQSHFNSGSSPLLSSNGPLGTADHNGSMLTNTMLRKNAANITNLSNRNSNNYYQLNNNGCRSRYNPPTEFHEPYDI